MALEQFKGTKRLTQLLFRQSRMKLIIWLMSFIFITLATATSYPSVYKTFEDMMGFGVTMQNPAMKAMVGPGYHLSDYNLGSIFANEMLLFTAAIVAVMNILLVSRGTRSDEEDGILELVRSLPIGKYAYLSANLIVVSITNLILTLSISFGLVLLGGEDFTWNASFLYGALLGSTGLIFTSITAFLAQLTETSRGAVGFSFTTLMVAYVIRAIGDVSAKALSYLSPLGWQGYAYVFVLNHWWPVVVAILFSILFISAAFYLNQKRDIGAGFLPQKKGSAHASRLLSSPLGLTLRLQRVNILSWAVGIFLFGIAFGAILGDMESQFSDMEIIQEILPDGETMTEQMVSMFMLIFAFISVIPAMMALLRLRGEETKHRMEYFLSHPVSRTKILAIHYSVAFTIGVLMQVLVALGLWMAGNSVIEGGLSFTTVLSSAMVFLPAFLVMISLITLILGLYPRVMNLVWLYLAYGFIVVYVGELLSLSTWLQNISVFSVIPLIPVEEVKGLPIMILISISTLLTFVGFISYNRRDIHS